MLGTLWTDDIVLVGDKSASYQASTATGAVEAVVMPMPVFEGDELSAADAGDWFVTPRKQLIHAISEWSGNDTLSTFISEYSV